ncbi:TolC family protein [Ferribacterium limneticum]|uniref:TolC family protein n=1 Tax=Ferribacterium limneticum TaxID=76259 RepID=UPI001CFA57CF|nr:TolC family protein [Ferribacterium limneticum]UCV29368.1 TolC family protein [Ferribacterium limneticum]UCV33287.1 TolC family protein [Ferribacterium limneticum]
MRSIFSIAPLVIGSLLGCLAVPLAQAATPLAAAFAQAWQRQPAALAEGERTRAVNAQAEAANRWTPAPANLELGLRSDRFNRNQGASEVDIGLAVPLWLPGERSGAQALAAAAEGALAGRQAALRLQLAQALREAWWQWQLSQNEAVLAKGREAAARRLRDDVARRFQAGDLARADLNQAEGALALAQAAQAEAHSGAALARYRLESLTGAPATEDAPVAEPEPLAPAVEHPELRDLQGRGELARRNAELARVQSRANPELTVATRRDRPASGELAEQTWAVGVRIPFGGGPRHDARVALANAEAIEAAAMLERERERLVRAAALAQVQVDAARAQLAAAEQRARVAGENRGFYDKSFRLGESDLPTRLRIETEAVEAERALMRARIALAQGISQWRQSLGLLPE